MHLRSFTAAALALTLVFLQGAAPTLAAIATASVPVSSLTNDVEGDFSVIYYGKKNAESLLVGNDGSAATGGWKAWKLVTDPTTNTLREHTASVHGRTKVVGVMYDVGEKDVIVSIAATDSVLRVYEVADPGERPSNRKVMLGHWSALCPWRSPKTGNQYFYLFGKKRAVQFIIRREGSKFEILEVQTFDLPVEPNSCAVSPREGTVYFSADDDKTIYSFTAKDSTTAPEITVLGKAEDDITGLATYVTEASIYLFVASGDTIGIYSPKLELRGTIELTNIEDIEIEGLSIGQSKSANHPAGLLSYVLASKARKSFGVSSLELAFKKLDLEVNVKHNPRPSKHFPKGNKHNGFGNRDGSLSCFAGFAGKKCLDFTCKNDCSNRGKCVGPNVCKCKDSWSGPDCSFLLVEPKFETDASGGDGDDPAIWISPYSGNKSMVITTTKSSEGAGLAVFNLTGNLLQVMKAGQPNNVDVIYGMKAGQRTIDLAYAACREENTLCLFEITREGLLAEIPGGSQPTKDGYKVYGSCAYRSPSSGKQYLFVNSKSSEYLQYELTVSSNGTLSTTLVRSFTGGSGGQPEGCVADEDAGVIFIGEEATGVWRYDAEPDGRNEGTMVARAGDGTLFADVEGLTLVPGKTASQGFLIVSCQGVSAFSVFRRAAPHEHVLTFTIGVSSDGRIDAVSNTDGVAAVGTRLSADFPHGLIVVHDDANQLPSRDETSPLTSFKLVSLKDVLGNEALADLKLLDEVDKAWGLDRLQVDECR
ncbi:3-phytase [Histoplasma capsulatum H143]|uniref:3-phytase n=1 Tax=Ajellomyces capsulatus (strain H143) TaxID=544712 RepID=C6H7G9_AJECH|nr:3-phytase [Histoplasma capsulatum H143]